MGLPGGGTHRLAGEHRAPIATVVTATGTSCRTWRAPVRLPRAHGPDRARARRGPRQRARSFDRSHRCAATTRQFPRPAGLDRPRARHAGSSTFVRCWQAVTSRWGRSCGRWTGLARRGARAARPLQSPSPPHRLAPARLPTLSVQTRPPRLRGPVLARPVPAGRRDPAGDRRHAAGGRQRARRTRARTASATRADAARP